MPIQSIDGYLFYVMRFEDNYQYFACQVSGDSPDMPSLETGNGGSASNSSDSPTSETSTAPNIQVEVRLLLPVLFGIFLLENVSVSII